MSRVFYILGIVFSIVFMFITVYYAAEVSSARLDYLFRDFTSYSYGGNYSGLTEEAALWSLLFISSFIAIDLFGLLKVKTKTTKVISIIGLTISGLILLWDLGVLSSPSSMSFDEVSPAWILYCLVMMAFNIIGLIQSIRHEKYKHLGKGNMANNVSEDLLDS